MSLDVYLTTDGSPTEVTDGMIAIRENGFTRMISQEEWESKFPGTEPVVMHKAVPETVYSANITHNLGPMADAAGIYKALWRPEEIGITTAKELIGLLTVGLDKLKNDPTLFETFNAPNGWGLYEHFVPFVSEYLDACRQFPHARVNACR